MRILAELTGGVVLILIFAFGVRYLVASLTKPEGETHDDQQPD